MNKIERIKDDKWPRDIRDAVNLLIDRTNRNITIVLSTAAGGPTVDDGDNEIIITLPAKSRTDCDGNVFLNVEGIFTAP